MQRHGSKSTALNKIDTRINNKLNLENQKILSKININVTNRVNIIKSLDFGNNNITKPDNRANLYKKLDFKDNTIIKISNKMNIRFKSMGIIKDLDF